METKHNNGETLNVLEYAARMNAAWAADNYTGENAQYYFTTTD